MDSMFSGGDNSQYGAKNAVIPRIHVLNKKGTATLVRGNVFNSPSASWTPLGFRGRTELALMLGSN